MEFTTYAVCVRFDNKRPIEWRFPIERELRKLARAKGSYVISVLDCCRERWTTKDDNFRFPIEDETEGERNLILTFGCPPNCTVDANSFICLQYFQQLKSMAEPETGKLEMPGRIQEWTTKNGGETLALVAQSVEMHHTVWDRVPDWDMMASYQRQVNIFIHVTEDGKLNTKYKDRFHKLGLIPDQIGKTQLRVTTDPNTTTPLVETIEINNPKRKNQLKK